MPFLSLSLLFLLLLLPSLQTAQRTFDLCTQNSTCLPPRTCQSFFQTPCLPNDPLCFCQPPTLTPCTLSTDCPTPEVCVQDIQFRLFCAHPSALSRLSILAPAPPPTRNPPPAPAPIFSDCTDPSDPRQCSPSSTCLNLATFLPCNAERNCACIGNDIQFCLRHTDCPSPLVCVQAPILQLPFCAPPPAADRWLPLTRVEIRNVRGLTFEPCRADADCLGSRLCRDFDDRAVQCVPGTPCLCIPPRPRMSNSCRAVADCPERGEICATNQLFPDLGAQCVSTRARDVYEFVEQVNSRDVCPVIIQRDLPADTVRAVLGSGVVRKGVRVARGREWGLRGEVRITGGEEVNPALQLSLVVLRTPGGSVCTGTLVSRRWVLSAAHCRIVGSSAVAFGRRRLDLNGTDFEGRVRRVFNHPLYDEENRSELYDLALIELEDLAPERMRPLKVNSDEKVGVGGEPVRSIGYGAVNGTEGDTNLAVLRQVDLRIVSRNACNEANQRLAIPIDIRRPLQICARSARERCGPCFGDSGGPLLAYPNDEPIIIGVTTAAVLCDTILFPALYTRVSGLIQFLRSTGADFAESSAGTGGGSRGGQIRARGSVTCNPGFRLSNGLCVPCARDERSAGQGRTRCTKCRQGFVQDSEDGSKCSCRGANAVGMGVKNGVCRPCPMGTFSGREDLRCRPCPDGTKSGRGAGACS